MISKELIEKAKSCSTKEEMLELAKAEKVEINELSENELSNVVGGTCTSSDSYDKLGIFHSMFQSGSNNPVIVTVGNSCRLSKRACVNCKYSSPIGITYYCGLRSEQLDPAKDSSFELQNDGSSVRHNNTIEIISY